MGHPMVVLEQLSPLYVKQMAFQVERHQQKNKHNAKIIVEVYTHYKLICQQLCIIGHLLSTTYQHIIINLIYSD